MAKVTWHRADGDVAVDLDGDAGVYKLRPYYYSVPVLRDDLSGYFDYWEGDEVAVSLVIARDYTRPSYHFPELITKQVFWLIKHLCERTDVSTEGVAIQLSIDNALRGMATPYIQACNYPEDCVNWFEHDGSMSAYWGKFEAMFSDVFKNKERVLHVDANYMIGWHPTQRAIPMFDRIKCSAWRDMWRQKIAVAGSLVCHKTPSTPSPLKRDMWNDVKEGLADYMGHSIDDEEHYWSDAPVVYHISGRMWGLEQSLRNDQGFRDDIRRLVEITTCDEISLQTYARKQGWTAYDAADISLCFQTLDVMPSDNFGNRHNVPCYSESRLIHSEHNLDSECESFWLSLYN